MKYNNIYYSFHLKLIRVKSLLSLSGQLLVCDLLLARVVAFHIHHVLVRVIATKLFWFIICSICNGNLDEKSQEENLKMKKLKQQLGEPLSWSDYLSLPFTQTVSFI
jgi:hypothetical protein